MSNGQDPASPEAQDTGWSTGYVTPGVPIEKTVTSPMPAYTSDPGWPTQPAAEQVAAPPAPPPAPAPAPAPPPYAAPPQPYTPYSANPTPTKRPMRTGAILGIVLGSIGGLLVIVIVAGIAIVSALGAPSRDASAAVTAYLAAVQKGDASAALAQVATPPTNTTLLTDAVLARSAKYAKITDVSVSYVSGGSRKYVGARFRIGGSSATAVFTVVKSSSRYRIDGDSLPRLSLDGLVGVPVTIDGVNLVPRGGTLPVFPGTYSIESATPYLILNRSSLVQVRDSLSSGTTGLTAVVTDAGYQEFRTVLASAIQACVAQTTLDAGCGLALPATLSDGTQLVEGSITRSLPSASTSAIDTVAPYAVSSMQPAVLTADVDAEVDVTARCSSGGYSGACSLTGTPELETATIDLTARTPSVEWN